MKSKTKGNRMRRRFAEVSSELIYRNYLARMCTPEEYRRRGQRIQEEQREKGLRVTDLDQVVQQLVADQKPAFERLWRKHFLVDLYPGNAERFPVSYAEVSSN